MNTLNPALLATTNKEGLAITVAYLRLLAVSREALAGKAVNSSRYVVILDSRQLV
jgi:hypothetical protein